MDEQSKYELASGQELSEKMMEDIIKGLENKDRDALRSLFAEDVQEMEDFELQLERFINFYKSGFIEFNGNTSERRNRGSGRLQKFELKGNYFLHTETEDYRIAFFYKVIDREEPSMRGLVSIQITTEEVFDKETFQWNYTDEPGIYVQTN